MRSTRGSRSLFDRVEKRLATVFVASLLSIGVASPLHAQPPAGSASDGEALFKTRCTACHTIGGGTLVGPDLKGVTERRTREWLTSWISAPDRVLAAHDPIAQQLFQDFHNVPMPNLGLNESQVVAILAYLAGGSTVVPVRQAALEAGDAAIGKALFEGARRFQNGGPPCMGCHSIVGLGALGGGALGPDLTPSYTKYGGDAGLASFLEGVPTVTMSAVWTRQPMTPDERTNVRAFLRQASVSGRPIEALGRLAALAIAGTVVLLVVAQLVWRKRLVAVRRPMVARMRRDRTV